ncbi:MAG: hypothetical protein F6K17_23370 [Okeania sp. SIO3C4]|nr:hypothetical protein [Okeania sp. SIO3C4]
MSTFYPTFRTTKCSTKRGKNLSKYLDLYYGVGSDRKSTLIFSEVI